MQGVTRAEREPWPETVPPNTAAALRLAIGRYRGLGPEPYWFAWGKLRFDPMFRRLVALVGPVCRLLDLGAGYGVPTVWLLAHHPCLQVTAIESDPHRAQVAAWAIGQRGVVLNTTLPDLSGCVRSYDRALLIDVLHYLEDPVLDELLLRVRARLDPGGVLVLRDTVPSPKRVAWERRLEGWRLRRRGLVARFRSTDELLSALSRARFDATVEPISGREETWFLARLH
jgi:predicted O-methyltransferase YrrM